MPNFPLLKFSSGELSPQIDSRSDVDKYSGGCRILENLIPRIYGPATRRPGTKYIDTCNGVARNISFIYSNTIAYMLLLEDKRMYFYYDGGRVLDTWGRRLKLDTPYLAADLFELQYKQSNDVMWIVHPSYAQRKLSRVSANEFSLDEITFTNGPFMKRNDIANDDGITITPSATTGTGNLTASSATFAAGHVGALFSITQPRVNTSISGTLQATGVLGGTSILTEGPCTLNISDGWSGTVQLQRSIDDGVTWEVRRSFYSNDGKRAIQYAFNEEEDDVLHRIYVSEYNATYAQQISITDEDGYVGEQTIYRTSKISGDLTVDSSTQMGICRITGYVSDTIVNMTVLKSFASTNADTRWAEGCWSTYRGFPSSVTFFEERVVYAGTPYQPQTVWLSASDDYENFKEGTNDDDSFSLTISSETRNAIQWVASLDSILIGTSGGEWRAGSTDEGDPITPTNFNIKQQTSYGSMALQASQVGDVILFADFVGRKVREIVFSGERYKYIAPDLTALAEHITKSGIVGMAFQRNPDPIMWCFLTDGTLISMTYEREQNVIAWARHPFRRGDDVESVYETSTTGILTIPQYAYPTLQDLTDEEKPDKPTEPTITAGTTTVANAAQLQNMTGSNKYILTSDIDLTGVTWTPISTATSGFVLDGAGYAIKNLDINSAADNQGLFSSLVENIQVHSVIFENCSVTGKDKVGILAGELYDGEHILKSISFINCDITSSGDYAGMLFGYHANASHRSENDKFWNISATDCDITSTAAAAGTTPIGFGIIAGYLIPTLTAAGSNVDTVFVDCSVAGGSVTITNGYTYGAGGFAGRIWGNLDDSEWFDNDSWTYFYNCTSSADVICQKGGKFIGGFVGGIDYMVKMCDCHSTGDVTVDYNMRYVGGFLGDESCYGYLVNCYSSGTVNAGGANTNTAYEIGGFTGRTGITPRQHYLHCWTTSNINVRAESASPGGYVDMVGGFSGLYEYYQMGYLAYLGDDGYSALTERCWASGDITISGDVDFDSTTRVGGFAGFIDIVDIKDYYHLYGIPDFSTIIQNCYTWSQMSSSQNTIDDGQFGGFIGQNDQDSNCPLVLTNVYSAQTDTASGSGYTDQLPSGAAAVGGLVAYDNTPVVTASYWDTDTSGIFDSIGGVGHITIWMTTKQNYVDAGWNFTTIWYGLDDLTEDYSTTGLGISYGLGVNSVAVIPSSAEDEVWVIVARYINGSVVRYLEQMQPRDWGDDDEDQWFVDSGLDYDGTADTTFSGLDHLEGEEVAVLADGAVVSNQTVTNGGITLTNAASRVIVGLPYRYILKPMRIDFTRAANTSQTVIKTIPEIIVSFYKSGGVEFGVDTDHLFKLKWRTNEDFDTPTELYTGDKLLCPEGGFDPQDIFILTGNTPVNATIRSIIPRVFVSGR